MKGWGAVAFVCFYVVPFAVIVGGGVILMAWRWEKAMAEWAAKVNGDLDQGE